MPTVKLNDIAIYYETSGDPVAPPLMIIAGLGDTAGKCAWQSEPLAQQFYVITFDNRGVGRSAPLPPGYSTLAMAGDAAALLDHLSVRRANVFGFSLGGMIAQQLALTRPDLVGRLALGCTTAGGALWHPPDDLTSAALANPTSSGDAYQDYLAGTWMSFSPAFPAENPEIIRELAELSAHFPQDAGSYRGQIEAALSHDVAASISSLAMPVLVLHGELDRLIPLANGLDLARAIPGAELIVYPDAGHLFFIEQAETVNHDLEHFFLARGPYSPSRRGLTVGNSATRPITETR